MRVKVHQQGGVFGLDRVVEVNDDTVSVADDGATRAVGAVATTYVDLLRDLVLLAFEAADVESEDGHVIDSMTTDVVLEDGERKRNLRLQSGQEVDPSVQELIQAVTRAGENLQDSSTGSGDSAIEG